MKTVAIIQARLGSTRLPMKSLLCLRGTPLIDWVVNRVHQARMLDEVVVACPDTRNDRVLADHLHRTGTHVVTGSETDVLARFLVAARATQADRIVRICADNPFIWGEAIDRLVRHYDAGDMDYCYNHIPRNNLWPDGFGAEIVGRDLLEHLGEVARERSQREHCLNYLWDNSGKFRMRTFDPDEDWLRRPDIRLDIDTPDDFCRLAMLPVSPTDDARSIISAMDKAAQAG